MFSIVRNASHDSQNPSDLWILVARVKKRAQHELGLRRLARKQMLRRDLCY